MRVGILIIGIHGASASTLVAGYLKHRSNKEVFRKGSYWCSVKDDFPTPIYDMVFGGWDYRFNSLENAIHGNNVVNYESNLTAIEFYPPILGTTDYAVLVDGQKESHTSLENAIEAARENIRDFRLKHSLDKVIVLNSSSPKYCNQTLESDWSSNQAYSLATVFEGADWIEFTPSDSITPELVNLAKKNQSRLAGRDGSTGQTILKIYLRDYFGFRGFEIDSWYSTNLIGNHDGDVLRHSEFNKTKLQDKLSVLPESIVEKENHIVEIQYVPPAGDNKESWDCIHFSGWLDSKMSMRINWHGKDSFLASILMLDIIAGLIHAEDNNLPYGLVVGLGVFFKNPIGQTTKSCEELLKIFREFAKLVNK